MSEVTCLNSVGLLCCRSWSSLRSLARPETEVAVAAEDSAEVPLLLPSPPVAGATDEVADADVGA